MKLESMSSNIVNIMLELIKNEGLCRLLVSNDSTPFVTPVSDRTILINPTSDKAKIFPYPFDIDATTADICEIRVYYNTGKFNENETIAESQLLIDVICARSLWLISDNNRSLIRPYEIIGRIIDMLGRNSLNTTVKLNFESYQHLYINTKYDALRLYCNYMSVEA